MSRRGHGRHRRRLRRALPARVDPPEHAGRPAPAQADRRRLDGVWGVVVFAHRARAERLLAVHRPARHRHQPVLRPAGERPAAHRHLSDPGAARGCSPPTAPSRSSAGSSRRSSPAASRASWPGRRAGGGCSSRCPSSSIPVVLGLAAHQGAPPGSQRDAGGARARSWRRTPASCPISLSVAFERLRKIRSFYFFLAGMAALGFALFSIPLFLNLYLEDELGLSAWERGVFGSLVAIPGIAALAIAGAASGPAVPPQPTGGDAVHRCRSSPGSASFIVVGPLHAERGAWSASSTPSASPCRRRPSSSVVSITSSVIPYRLRSRGHRHGRRLHLPVRRLLRRRAHRPARPTPLGRRGALTLIVLPSTLIGGALIAYGARLHPRRHLALRRGAARGEGRGRPRAAGRRRRRRPSRSATSTSPTARCRCCSTSTSTCAGARRWRCSAPTAPASRRCCG